MTKLNEALRLAECLTDYTKCTLAEMDQAAAKLRRLHALNQELLESLSDIAHGLESARIWGGMEWTYTPLHPVKYLPLRDKARAALAKAQGEKK